MIDQRSSSLMPAVVASKLDEFSEELKEIGVSYVGYGIVTNKGDHIGYFSRKDWGMVYVDQGLFFEEPILENFNKDLKSTYTVDWSKIGDNKVPALRQEHVKIISGTTFKHSNKTYDEYLNVAFSHRVDPAEFTARNLSLICSYFFAYQRTCEDFFGKT